MNHIRVLLVDDDDLFRKSLSKELKRSGFQVRTAASGRQALVELKAGPADVVLLDIRLPDLDGMQVLRSLKKFDPSVEVIMLTAYGTIDTAVASLKAGAYHYLVKPAKLAEIDAAIQKAHEKRGLVVENQALKDKLGSGSRDDKIVGESARMMELLALVEKVAPSDQTVLIQGESGTGKDLIARRIHKLSPRHDGPFVLVDCGSLSKSLLESELFGHEKGAFTGATGVKHGLVEAAHQGTLFADEVGALAPEIQAAFLRLMETQEFRRVGATTIRKADLRIVAATNTDLAEAVREGNFREDLYFRLSVILLSLPPLRRRPDDVPLLAEYFLRRTRLSGHSKRLSEAALRELQRHSWPGNVRELKNTIERAALLSDGDVIEPWDLRILSSTTDRIVRRVSQDELVPLNALQSRYIDYVLEKSQGNQQKAAKILDIDPKTIYRHLKKK